MDARELGLAMYGQKLRVFLAKFLRKGEFSKKNVLRLDTPNVCANFVAIG